MDAPRADVATNAVPSQQGGTVESCCSCPASCFSSHVAQKLAPSGDPWCVMLRRDWTYSQCIQLRQDSSWKQGQSLLMEEVLSVTLFIVRFLQEVAVQKTLAQPVSYTKADGIFFIVLLEDFFLIIIIPSNLSGDSYKEKNFGFHSKVKSHIEENIHRIHSFLMKTLNTQSFVSSFLCPAYCLCNELLSLRRTKMPQCLTARKISSFRSLHLGNCFTVMDNSETKLPGRSKNKCFSEWG